jgi:hypothetical protein
MGMNGISRSGGGTGSPGPVVDFLLGATRVEGGARRRRRVLCTARAQCAAAAALATTWPASSLLSLPPAAAAAGNPCRRRRMLVNHAGVQNGLLDGPASSIVKVVIGYVIWQ